MKTIGLTGGIGSGKSTVAFFVAQLGAHVLDLDKVGNEILKKDNDISKRVVREFGASILNKSGEINRKKLGKIVFNDREALMRLNNIMHPEIDKVVAEKTGEWRSQGVKVAVLEAAAMMEAGRDWQVDEIWVTIAPEKVVLKRIMQRSAYGEAETKARIHSQMTNKERTKRATVVINNNGTPDELKSQVKAEWEKLQKRL
jgi:dephospho-CoA kinase